MPVDVSLCVMQMVSYLPVERAASTISGVVGCPSSLLKISEGTPLPVAILYHLSPKAPTEKNGGAFGGAGTHGAFHQARTGGSGKQNFLFCQQDAAQIVGNAALQGGGRFGSVSHHWAAHGGKYFRCYFSGSGNE